MSNILDSSIERPPKPLAVPSPYEGTVLTTRQHLEISCLWMAINAHWGAILVILLPNEIAHIAPNLRAQALGAFSGIGALMALFTPLVIGPLSDRCRHASGRRKPYIAAGIILNLLGLAAMAIIANNSQPYQGSMQASIADQMHGLLLYGPYLLFLAAYLLVQIGSNVTSAAYMGYVPDLVPENQRGLASGFYAVMSQIGTLVGAVGVGLVLGGSNTYVKFGFVGILLFFTGAITLYFVRENPLNEKIAQDKWRTYFEKLIRELLSSSDFIWVWITRFLVMLGFYAIQPFINYYLVDVIGLKKPDGPAAELIGIILIASSISGFLGGKISDRIGRKKVVYWSSVTMAIFVILFTFCHTFYMVLGVGLLFGTAFGAYVSVDWALGADALPNKDDAGTDMAIWHIAMTLPQSIAPPIAGLLIGGFVVSTQIKGGGVHYGVIGYGLVFFGCAISFLLGGILIRNVKHIR